MSEIQCASLPIRPSPTAAAAVYAGTATYQRLSAYSEMAAASEKTGVVALETNDLPPLNHFQWP